MRFIFGKTKKDIIRYGILAFLLLFGVALGLRYGIDCVLVYIFLVLVSGVTITFKSKYFFLPDIVLPVYAVFTSLFINHGVTCYLHPFYNQTRPNSIFRFIWSQGLKSYIFEILIILGLYFFVRFFRLSPKVAAIVAPIPTALMSITDYFVFQFRGSELTPSDILSARTAMNVASNYDFPMRLPIVVAFVPLAIYIFSIVLIKIEKHQNNPKAKFRFTWWIKSIICLVISASCVFGLYKLTLYYSEDNQGRIWDDEASEKNGFITNFFILIKELNLDPPDNYNADDYSIICEPVEPYDSDVNIIVIMNESYTDFSIYANAGVGDTFIDPAPFWNSLRGQDNVRSGYARSSVFAGVTANSEFEALTGLTTAGLPIGSVPYALYLSSPIYSLPSYLRDIGYETYAMHPYMANGWNRPVVYPNLGFQNISFIDDFNYTPDDIIRGSYALSSDTGFMSDECAYRNLLETIDNRDSDAPGFYFLVTIQNHGGYELENEKIQPEEYATGTANDERYNIFLSNIHRSDEALEMLISELSNRDEKYIVLIFGDHQPALEVNTVELDDPGPGGLKWFVPYLIWANYDVPEGFDIAEADTSINYFAIDILNGAGIPLSPYFQIIADIRSDIPIVTASSFYDQYGNQWLSTYAAPLFPGFYEILTRYYGLQYYNLFEYKPN